MSYHKLTKEIRKYVFDYFESRPDPRLYYHTIGHTERVVKAAAEIAGFYNYDVEQLFIVTTAAWFHDLGYLSSEVEHEDRGVKLVRTFLADYEIDEAVINQIAQAILATRLPQKPLTKLEEILCDADLYELGTAEFKTTNKQFRKERAAFNITVKSRVEVIEEDLIFLDSHHFFTD